MITRSLAMTLLDLTRLGELAQDIRRALKRPSAESIRRPGLSIRFLADHDVFGNEFDMK